MFERSRLGVRDIFSWLRFKGRAFNRMKLSFMSGSWIIYECSSYPWVPYSKMFIVYSSFILESLSLWSGYLRASTLRSVWISALPHFKTHCEFNFIQSKVKNKYVWLIWLCPQGLVFLLLLSSVPVPWDNKNSLCGKLFSSRCCVLIDKTHVRQNIRNQQVSLDIQLCFCYSVYSLSL